jgi:hypothetical protein
MEEWRGGRMEEWKGGRVEGWKGGRQPLLLLASPGNDPRVSIDLRAIFLSRKSLKD